VDENALEERVAISAVVERKVVQRKEEEALVEEGIVD
jgi:hypothetical protein